MSIAMVGGLLVSSIVTGRIISDTGRLEALPRRRHGPGRRRPRPARHHRRRPPTWSSSALFMAILGVGLGATMQNLVLVGAEQRARCPTSAPPAPWSRSSARWAARSASRCSARLLAHQVADKVATGWPRIGHRHRPATRATRSPTWPRCPPPVREVFEHAFGAAVRRAVPRRRAVRGPRPGLRPAHQGGAAAHLQPRAPTPRPRPRSPPSSHHAVRRSADDGDRRASTPPRRRPRCQGLEQEVGVMIRRIRRVIGERARAVHPDLQPRRT